MAVDLGDVVRLDYTNLSPAGAPVSAATMTVTITLPDLTTAGPVTVAPDTTGVYHYDYQTVQAGRHQVRWVGTGTNPGAQSDSFDVRPASPMYIVSLADIKQQLNKTDTVDDEELRVYLEATTGVVESVLGRAVVRRSFTEEHTDVNCEMMLNWTPVQSLTSVATVDGVTTWNVADLHVSKAGVVTARSGAALVGDIAVTYVAGEPVVPANWALAARIILQHLWETQRGTSGTPRPGGMEAPGAGFTGYGYAIPYRAKELLTGGLAGV